VKNDDFIARNNYFLNEGNLFIVNRFARISHAAVAGNPRRAERLEVLPWQGGQSPEWGFGNAAVELMPRTAMAVA
jgi:hypothetical protein